MRDKTLMGQDNMAVELTLARIRKKLLQYSKKKDIKIDRDSITNTILPKNNTNRTPRTRAECKPYYDELLQGKVKNKNTKEKVIQYAELIMQETTYAHLTLTGTNMTDAILKIIACLPEHEQIFTNYWINKKIDSNNFSTLVNKFDRELKNYNIGQVNITQPPRITGTGTIKNTQTLYTYT